MFTTGMAQAQVTNLIYQDTFARSGPLSGSMPDTANATGAKYIAGPLVYTGTWTDQNGNTENACYFSNSIPAVLGPIFNEAFLPITVQTGHVYTLSASFLVNTNYNGNYMFLAYDTCPSLQIIANSWYAGMLLRSTNNPYTSGNLQTFAGANQATPATNNFTPSGTPWNPQFITLTSVLNLTNPAAITEYWFTNGVPFRTNVVGANIAGGNNGMWPRYITFGQNSAAGYVTNLTFTDVVPYPSGPTILEQPNNLSAPQGQTATFWVNAVGAPDPAYQWMTNNGSGWVNIPGATNATYTTPPLSSALNGLNYQVELTNVAGLLDSDPATLTVTAASPTVFSATKTTSPTSIVVNLSGAVDPATSLNAANYTLNNGASVTSVNAGSVPSSVVLTTSALAPGGAYNLAVKNVQDLFGDVMAASTNAVLPAGLVLDLRGDSGVEFDASGTSVAQWLDQTTNGNNAFQFLGWRQNVSGISRPSTTTRPTAGTLNSLPALTFNAANVTFLQVASTLSVSINTNLTVYCVAQVSDTVQNRHFISKNVGNQPGSFELDAARAASGTPVETDLLSGSAGSGANGQLGGSGIVSAPHVFAATRAFQTIFTNAWTAGLSFPSAQTNWFYTASNTVSVYLDGIVTKTAAVNEAAPGCFDGGEPVYIGTRQ
ncbi:MAG TPA: immunoglobulin domain-containing protein, partial [Tepidisphaeraceae bacterium]|nr:immunoglobulin domain-containing protein [Tepidisphaeraceae bacterium]